MKKLTASLALLGAILFLSGCAALPRPREMENMALFRTLGVDYEEGYVLTVSTEEEEPLVLTAGGRSLEEALEGLQLACERRVFLGYVDRLLVGSGVGSAHLAPVLDKMARSGELTLGAGTWLVAGRAEEAVRSSPARRLETLVEGETEFCSAGSLWSALLEGGSVTVPTLVLEDGLLSPAPAHSLTLSPV